MSILDDAIREHLELKRRHGADESELKRLEDEAFGPAGRPEEPDPFAEAPTEFMTAPGAPGAEGSESAEGDGGRRINIADLQEAPPEPAEPEEEPRIEVTESVEPQAEAAPAVPAEDPAQAAPPAEEEPSAMEHEVVPEAEAASPESPAEVADAGLATDERHAIAEQPTEFFDVEAEMGTEDAPAPEIEASRAEPVEQPAAEDDYDEDEEFWSDQRLSEELDNALEAPLADERDAPVQMTDEHDIPAPTAQPAAPIFGREEDEPAPAEPREHDEFEPSTGHEDVLEDTPDFLEDAPEDDELWFEQRPPKDFDFDD